MAIADVPVEVRPERDDSIRGGSTADSGYGHNQPASDINSSAGVTGYAKHLSHPAYHRLLQSEGMLKRLVPVLIITLLAIIGYARWHSFAQQGDIITDMTRQKLYFLAELIDNIVTDELVDPSHAKDPESLQNSLAAILPNGFLKQGRVVIVNNTKGRIVATIPYQPNLTGKSVAYALGDLPLLGTLDQKADFREAQTPEFGKAILMRRVLEDEFGDVYVVQPIAPLFSNWRQTAALNVTLFVCTSTILLFVLYAYFSQATRVREADQLYSKTQTRFDTALNRGRCGLWDWNLARGNIYWSCSMYELLGQKTRMDLLSFKSVSELIHPDDVNLYTLANEVMENDQTHVDQLFRMRHVNGDWIWIRNRCEIVISDDGEKHLIGIAIDVTEQERIKAENVEKDHLLRDAIESLSQAFVLWDSKSRLVMCNSNYFQMHQIPPEKVTPGMTHSEVMAFAEKALTTKTMVTSDNHHNGTAMKVAELEDGRWLQINERKTNDGGTVSVSTDITAHKRQESKLMESQNRLKKTVADLTESQHKAEVQAKQLSELAQKYANEKNNAEKANKIKSEFLANISHEWRTPLNAIIGFSEIMVGKTFGPLGDQRYEEYARDIHSSGGYLLGVINDILDMSKIEAGRLELHIEPCNLDEIVDESIRIVNYQTSERNIIISDETTHNIAMEADRRAIKQIMINLMSNAAKFSHSGGRIVVRSKTVGKDLFLSICDNGIGIAEEDLKRLGKPFEQVQNQLTKDHKGSGLGLAITRSLVEAHNGRFKISSKSGSGTIVTLRIPLKQQENIAKAA